MKGNENLTIEENKSYKLSKEDQVIEFYVVKIDKSKNIAETKVTSHNDKRQLFYIHELESSPFIFKI